MLEDTGAGAGGGEPRGEGLDLTVALAKPAWPPPPQFCGQMPVQLCCLFRRAPRDQSS